MNRHIEKAKELVDEKYGTVFDELEDIRERLNGGNEDE